LLLRQLPDLAPGFVGRLNPPAVNPDPAVRSDPLGAAANIGVPARDRHGDVPRVFQFDAIFRAGVPHRVHWGKLALALDLEGAGVIEIATPVGDVAMVPDPVEQLAPARVVVPAPVPVNPAPDVWHHFGGASPCLEIQLWRRRRAGNHVPGGHGTTLPGGQAHFNPGNLPDQAVPHDLRRLVERAYGALPGAGLPDAAVGLNGADNGLLFSDCAGERFLTVDILLLPGSLDCGQGMPMVREGQHDGVNVAPRHQLPIIMIRLAAGVLVMAVDLLHERVEVRLVHVARGNHLAFLQGKERIGVPISHASTAYDAQADARRRRRLAGPPEHAAGDDGGESERGAAQAQELT